MSDEPKSQLLFYQAPDGHTRLEVRMQGETVWLTQAQMAELFQRERSVITKHIRNIFEEGELVETSVCANYAQTAADRKTYQTVYYNLDVIISVGYRVKSHRGTQSRIWATQRLREYIVKGFTMDDERLKRAGGGNYFEELLARIRDIRSAEKIFWRKVLDIYATSIDYDPGEEASQVFFATVQNKMHWATHGQTAAEVVHGRVDAAKQNLGMTTWLGGKPTKEEAAIAKNYLTAGELEGLNRIVTAYLEFAELRALNRQPMYMRDWIASWDDFLRLSGREILTHAGKISHEQALRKAEREFERFRVLELAQPSQVEKDFEAAVKRLPKSKTAKNAKNTKNEEAMKDIKSLSDQVRQIAYDIHVYHGHGHLEKVYENALAHRLRKAGLDVKQQHPIKVYDEDGTLIGDYLADVLVEGLLIIELKTAKTLAPEHEAQILGYLKSSRLEHGLLINFGSYKFEIRKFTWTEGQPQRAQGAESFSAVCISAFFAFFAVK